MPVQPETSKRAPSAATLAAKLIVLGAAAATGCCPAPPAQAPCPETAPPPKAEASAPASMLVPFAAEMRMDANPAAARGKPPRPRVGSLADRLLKGLDLRAGHVVDDLDWTPSIPPAQVAPNPGLPLAKVSQLLWQARTGTSVGYLSVPGGPGADDDKRCVGWLLRDDLLVTNTHCVKDEEEAKDVQVSFNYYSGVSSDELVWYPCSTVKQVRADLDITVLQCSAVDGKLPGHEHGKLPLADADPKPDDAIWVVHQNCDYHTDKACDPVKQVSPGKVKDEKDAKPFEFSHTADTLEGSSGAPVISASTFAVVGVHHAGCTKQNDCGKKTEDGRGHHNFAVRVSQLRALFAGL